MRVNLPFSARKLPRSTQIRDVQLLSDMIRVYQVLVIILIVLIILSGWTFPVGFLLLELTTFGATQLGFTCASGSRDFILGLLLFRLLFILLAVIVITVFFLASSGTSKVKLSY